ncbi:mitochondrial calcium uniporter [Homo sapiens]|uniref:Mitochondrial calcium uniporter n=1 Tax=Homo sapiens TaxID=9606 RepID=S4R332_HUMAN|nr:mitochondrial calcium uniporter [Homo sapiens]KAI4076353.1 mitochondrial calcium uniporter [Homo sapiens]
MLLGAAPESSPGPRRGRPSSSLVPEGSGRKENQTLFPSVTSSVCVHGEPAPSRWMLHCFRRQASSSWVLKGAFGGPFEGYCISVFTRA